MTDRQVAWVLFLFTMVISFLFLGALINNNYELDTQRRKVDDLQRQIISLKKMQEEDQQKVAGILKSTAAIEKDIDNTQTLQRLQAQKISDMMKKKR
jgi:hypothetical protein